MSAFLGPIHYGMYQKIKHQEEITDQMIELAKKKDWSRDLDGRMNQKFGVFDSRPLEEIIDGANIHGWLYERVKRAEDRLAAVLEEILLSDESCITELKKLFYDYGIKHQVRGGNAPDLYRELDAFLLDGMPCDRGRYILTQEMDDEVIWGYELKQHPSCTPVGTIENPFTVLREALILGMLKDSGFRLETLGETEYKIVKEHAS